MKKVLISALALMATLSIYAQGTVAFINNAATVVKVDTDGTGPVAAVNIPNGATYTVGLYWAPAGVTDESQFQLAYGLANKAGASIANFGPMPGGGLFNGGARWIPSAAEDAKGIAAGANVNLQVRAWDTASGATWAAALANSSSLVGKSSIFTVDTADPTTQPPQNAVSITGAGQLNSFTLAPNVPEPSTIALGLLGLAGLFVLRRRS